MVVVAGRPARERERAGEEEGEKGKISINHAQRQTETESGRNKNKHKCGDGFAETNMYMDRRSGRAGHACLPSCAFLAHGCSIVFLAIYLTWLGLKLQKVVRLIFCLMHRVLHLLHLPLPCRVRLLPLIRPGDLSHLLVSVCRLCCFSSLPASFCFSGPVLFRMRCVRSLSVFSFGMMVSGGGIAVTAFWI